MLLCLLNLERERVFVVCGQVFTCVCVCVRVNFTQVCLYCIVLIYSSSLVWLVHGQVCVCGWYSARFAFALQVEVLAQ